MGNNRVKTTQQLFDTYCLNNDIEMSYNDFNGIEKYLKHQLQLQFDALKLDIEYWGINDIYEYWLNNADMIETPKQAIIRYRHDRVSKAAADFIDNDLGIDDVYSAWIEYFYNPNGEYGISIECTLLDKSLLNMKHKHKIERACIITKDYYDMDYLLSSIWLHEYYRDEKVDIGHYTTC